MPTLLSPQVFINEIDQTVYNAAATGPAAAIILRNTYRGRENDTVLVSNENDIISRFGQPTNYVDCYRDMFSAIAYLGDSNTLYCTRVMPPSATFAGTMATSGVSATFTPFAYAAAPILGPGDGNVVDPDLYADFTVVTGASNVLSVISKDRGYCGNAVRIAVCDKTNHDLIRSKTGHQTWDTYGAIYGVDSPLTDAKSFLILIQECQQGRDFAVHTNWSTVEYWNVSSDPFATDDTGNQLYVEAVINGNSRYIRVAFNHTYDGANITNFASSTWQQLAGGRNNDTATNVTDASADEVVTDPILITALNLYSNAEQLPIDVIIDSDKSLGLKSLMVDIATTRKDCMSIMDCYYDHVVNQAGLEEQNLRNWIIEWRNTASEANTSYGAVYGNWLNIYDKYNDVYRCLPASGYVAGIFARCENTAQYWSAPAGFARAQINGVRTLAWNPTQSNRDGIYKYGINPIVAFSGQGKVVYGHKTMLDKFSAFNRINVRRLFISIENDIASIARTFLFEANNSLHRTAMVAEMKPILDYAQTHDGIDAYQIVCDDTNNTDATEALNEMVCDIYVKPTYVADYILITFIATQSSTNFTESAVTAV